MGIYLNPSRDGFSDAVNSPIYVDKTGMIEDLNAMIGTKEPMVCVCRPRRFGKTTAAGMLAAYYCKSYDSAGLFREFEISGKESFREHLNKYDVLWIDMQNLLEVSMTAVEYGEETIPLRFAQGLVVQELREEFPGIVAESDCQLPLAVQKIFKGTGRKFVVIIDEWDVVFRNYPEEKKLQDDYTRLLRSLFKGSTAEQCIALAYVTGILPPKSYGTESPMNNFKIFDMISPKGMAKYVGFTEREVQGLCEGHGMDFGELRRWYDGYILKGAGHVYNPRSVVEAISSRECANYWPRTETYKSLQGYIDRNQDGLKDAIVSLLGGQKCAIDVDTFQNDLTSFESRDDVMTLLVHLGYLAYDASARSAYIPNEEVRAQFVRAVRGAKWRVAKALDASSKLLASTLEKDAAAVASALEAAHSDSTSILQYNNENSLPYNKEKKHECIIEECII